MVADKPNEFSTENKVHKTTFYQYEERKPLFCVCRGVFNKTNCVAELYEPKRTFRSVKDLRQTI